MDHPLAVPLLTLGGMIVVLAVLLFLAGGGSMPRVILALRCLWAVLRDATFAAQVEPLWQPASPKETAPAKPSGVPFRLLALLQREGRLLDFLVEDIQSYPDAQVGAAVRDIHRQCQAALKEHLVLEPVLAQSEGAAVEVPVGFDPSAIRLVGNVTGQPPFRGTLQHHGWRVKELKLAPPPSGQDEMVLMPAEVEIA